MRIVHCIQKVLLFLWLLLIAAGCSPQPETPAVVESWYPATNADGDPVVAVFECRIPCEDCEKIKLALTLYADSETNRPTTYQMARVYVGKGNDRTINTGTWTITHGTGLDPQAVVYRLDTNAPEEFSSFWAVGEDILFILDQEGHPRVGDASYSYVLNRVE